MLNLICQACGIEFEWPYAQKKFCPSCLRERYLVQQRESQKRYKQTEAGKAYPKMYRQTEGGKAVRKAAKIRYEQTEGGKAVGKAAHRRYLKSDKGKAYTQARNAKAYAGQDYYQLLAFKDEAFRDQLPCSLCNLPWVDGPRGVTHEVDHIIPRALGGAHALDNLQVLCYECHKSKTSNDIKDIIEAKNEHDFCEKLSILEV